MKLLSFDVGIRNLAGCLFDLEAGELKIQWWKSMDLLEPTIYDCLGCLKNGDPCKNPSTWEGCTVDGTARYYCGTHKALHNVHVEKTEVKDVGVCDYGKCRGKAVLSVLDKVYCRKHGDKQFAKEKQRLMIKKIKHQTCKNIEPMSLKLSMWNLLDSMAGDLLTADVVVIENQPSLKNPTMKSIAETLFNYFLCRGVVDRARTDSNIKEVKYISPSNKMKLSLNNAVEINAISDKAHKYKKTKQLAVADCCRLLSDVPNVKEILAKHKKKDDMADSFLQGLFYLRTHIDSQNELRIVEAHIDD